MDPMKDTDRHVKLDGVNDEQPRNHGKSSHPPPESKERISLLQSVWNRLLCRKKESSQQDRSFSVDNLKRELHMDEHIVPLEELFQRLNVDPKLGLTDAAGSELLKNSGRNVLTPPKQDSEIVKWLKNTFGGFGSLMFAGALLSLFAFIIQISMIPGTAFDNLYVFIVMFLIFLFTGTFSYYQTRKSEKIMESFKKMVPENAKVRRNGVWKSLPADELVVGDIVEVRGGDRVPADIRVLKSQGFKVDNSSLTGETDPLLRTTESHENPMESKNLAFYTTFAVEGGCEAIVIRTGDKTVMGRIAQLTTGVGSEETPIGVEIKHCVKIITNLALIMGGIYIIVAFSLGVGWLDVITLSIGLMVGNMPGGLLIMVTAMLTLTARRLAAKNCLIKNLEAVEALGSCSIICSDKTGTLTQNRMTVSHIWVDDKYITNDATHPDPGTAEKFLGQTSGLQDVVRITSLCLRAKFQPDQETVSVNTRKIEGDASESAILRFLTITFQDITWWREKNPPLVEIPFNSTTKFQVSVHRMEETGRHLLVMKGAPEIIFSRCSTVLCDGKEMPKDRIWKEKFDDAYAEFGHLGERVLGMCDYELPAEEFPEDFVFDTEHVNFPLDGLRFIGLISMLDPPRATVPDAISKCRSAGIRVIMVTGDHPVTASAIARSVGIISAGSYTVEEIAHDLEIDVSEVNPQDATAAVIHGADLRDMTEAELMAVIANYPEVVFARTSPQQKLQIVEACQKGGAIVAVTGDGVNDSPALKKANIGVAMGITGSDVSKQAADLVLLDDNFASIVNGVEEGRLIFDNIKKTCCYAMTTDIPEVAPVILYFIMDCPLGLYTISMILLNCCTDLIPAVSLAHEPAESDTMKLPPRKSTERLITSPLIQAVYMQIGIIESVGGFFVYFVMYGTNGFLPRLLLGLRTPWEDSTIQDLQDSYGQEWTWSQRKLLERHVQTGFFLCVVLQNIFHLMVRRCRRISVFQKGFRNYFAIFAMFFEMGLACFFSYVPGLRTALGFEPMWYPFIYAILPFAVFLFVYDEIRRLVIRNYPGSWFDQNLYV